MIGRIASALKSEQGHVHNFAVLSVFFEEMETRAAHQGIHQTTFNASLPPMACLFCPVFGAEKDNLAGPSTTRFSLFFHFAGASLR